MIKKVLTLAKNLNSFSVDDVLMMTGLGLSDIQEILEKLVEEGQLVKKNNKYFFMSKPISSCSIEIIECKSKPKRLKCVINFVNASKIFFEEYVNINCAI